MQFERFKRFIAEGEQMELNRDLLCEDCYIDLSRCSPGL